MTETLVDALTAEIARNRELLALYKAIPAGAFGATMIEQDIQAAIAALASGDAIEIMRAHEALKGNE